MCGVIQMIKNLLLSCFLFVCSAGVTLAEEKKELPELYWTKKPIQCGTIKDVLEVVTNFGETPLIKADGMTVDIDGSTSINRVVFGANKKTGSWTIIEINGPQACVIGAGRSFSIAVEQKEEIKIVY